MPSQKSCWQCWLLWDVLASGGVTAGTVVLGRLSSSHKEAKGQGMFTGRVGGQVGANSSHWAGGQRRGRAKRWLASLPLRKEPNNWAGDRGVAREGGGS